MKRSYMGDLEEAFPNARIEWWDVELEDQTVERHVRLVKGALYLAFVISAETLAVYDPARSDMLLAGLQILAPTLHPWYDDDGNDNESGLI